MPFENKYQTIIQINLVRDKNFENAFEYVRQFPKILKAFIYGGSDRIFP